MTNIHIISNRLLNEMAEKCSAASLVDDKARQVFTIDGRLYVCTSFLYSPKPEENRAGLRECVAAELYEGKTCTYAEAVERRSDGTMSRVGCKFTCKGSAYVFTGNEMECKAADEPEAKQMELF